MTRLCTAAPGSVRHLITLGVNVANDCAFLTTVRDGELDDQAPYFLEPPAGLPPSQRILETRAAVTRMFESTGVDRVRLLQAEPTYKGTYSSFVARLTFETVFEIAAAERGLNFARLHRATVRSALGLPRGGQLAKLVSEVVTPSGPHWKNKRDLAALAALAASEDD